MNSYRRVRASSSRLVLDGNPPGFYFGLLLILVLGVSRAAAPPFLDDVAPRLSSQLPRESVAATEGALATIFNPAALDARPEADFLYLRTVQGEFARDDAFFLSWSGAGLGLEYFDAYADGRRVSVRRTTLSGGGLIVDGLHWGTARTWYASDASSYDALATWDVGLLFRKRWISLGAVARRFNRPMFRSKRLERTFDLGVAFRPGTDRATFWFDFRRADDESFRTAWRQRRFAFGLELEPIDGFRVAANAYGDGQFDVRASVHVDLFRAGVSQRLDHGESAGGVLSFGVQEGAARNALRRPRYVLLATPDEWPKLYWRLRRDRRVRAVVFKLDGEKRSLAEWQEMRSQLRKLREKGVPVITYINRTGTGGYWLAASTERILADPIADIRLIGLRSTTHYYKAAMDRFGVDAIFERSGKYKAGPEPFMRTGPSEPAQENENALLDDLYSQLLDGLAEGRAKGRDEMGRLIDGGPYLGDAAAKVGLVDEAVTPSDAEEMLRARFPGTELLTAAAYLDRRERPRAWAEPRRKIAVVPIRGMLVDGESLREPILGTRLVGTETVTRLLRKAASDEDVHAIVLDIDSGGGLVTASESIRRVLDDVRDEKPVVARIRGIGASGAYYIASGADAIVAEPTSITGSIGVYSGLVSVRDLYAKLGIATRLDLRGANADFFSVNADLSNRHRAVLREQVEALYDLFLRRVATGRGWSIDEAKRRGGGRVWTGRQALEEGLVDSLGGLEEAIERAKELAAIPPDRLVRVEFLTERTALDRLVALLERVSAGVRGRRVSLLAPKRWLDDGRLAYAPWHLAE